MFLVRLSGAGVSVRAGVGATGHTVHVWHVSWRTRVTLVTIVIHSLLSQTAFQVLNCKLKFIIFNFSTIFAAKGNKHLENFLKCLALKALINIRSFKKFYSKMSNFQKAWYWSKSCLNFSQYNSIYTFKDLPLENWRILEKLISYLYSNKLFCQSFLAWEMRMSVAPEKFVHNWLNQENQ